jgi:hypothetical protein
MKSLFYKIILTCLFLQFSSSCFSQYKISDIIEENKVQIVKPYKYDGFKMNEFTIGLINVTIPIEFVAFEGQKYKLIFCSSSFEEQVIVSIYNKASPKTKLAEKMIDQNNRSWIFEPSGPGAYMVEYEVPPSNTDVEHKACMVMLIGFKD